MDLKELRESKATLAAELKQMAGKLESENRSFDAEEQANWERLNADYDKVNNQLTVLERAKQLEGEKVLQRDPRPQADHRTDRKDTFKVDPNRALKAWASYKRGTSIDTEDAEHLKRCGFNPDASEINIQLRTGSYNSFRQEWRAQSVATPSAGGNTVAEGFSNEYDRAMLAFGGMRQACRVIRTDGGQSLPWPTVNDTGNKGVIINENETHAEEDTVWGSQTIGTYTYSSKMIKVSLELLQDSAFNLSEFLGSALGERISRAQNEHFTVGTGSSQPRGFVTKCVADSATVAEAGTNTLTAEDVINLVHGVDPAYRPGSAFMMSDKVLSEARKLRSDSGAGAGTGDFLWQPGLQNGIPDRLAGYPVFINQDMQGGATPFASGNYSMAFGDWSKYIIRDAGTLVLRRLVERFADSNQEAFVAFQRSDGDLINAGTNPIILLAH